MSEVTMIAIDPATRAFQLHRACANGTVVFRKKLTRVQLLAIMSQRPACIVAMEICATAYCWGREIEKLGHRVAAGFVDALLGDFGTKERRI